jgi:hypothetical protein
MSVDIKKQDLTNWATLIYKFTVPASEGLKTWDAVNRKLFMECRGYLMKATGANPNPAQGETVKTVCYEQQLRDSAKTVRDYKAQLKIGYLCEAVITAAFTKLGWPHTVKLVGNPDSFYDPEKKS